MSVNSVNGTNAPIITRGTAAPVNETQKEVTIDFKTKQRQDTLQTFSMEQLRNYANELKYIMELARKEGDAQSLNEVARRMDEVSNELERRRNPQPESEQQSNIRITTTDNSIQGRANAFATMSDEQLTAKKTEDQAKIEDLNKQLEKATDTRAYSKINQEIGSLKAGIWQIEAELEARKK